MQKPIKMPANEPKKDTERDLGLGSVVTNESGSRFLNRDGTFNVKRTGINEYSKINVYHWLLTMKWRKFMTITVAIFFGLNILFAVAYMICGNSALADTSNQPTQNVFLRAFFFSVQTFATIGYGTLHPNGLAANFLVTIESLVGILSQALVTGMLFARFSRPTARIKLSDVAVIAPYKEITGFMFRLVNERVNQLIELEMKIAFARFVDENGKKVRNFDALELERDKVSFFPLAWTVVHPIDENSPLFGLTEQDLINGDAEFLILLTANDETFAQTVHTRSSYKSSEIVWNAKFVSIYNQVEEGEAISIDVRKLSEIEKTSNN
jgi:inward rectifier potassium channel